MTITTSPFTVTSDPLDEDTAARVALAIAGLSGNPSVAIGIRAVGGAARFVAAVHDHEDTAIPLASARQAAGKAGAQLEVLEGLGHLAHEERPDLVAAAIRGFVGEP